MRIWPAPSWSAISADDDVEDRGLEFAWADGRQPGEPDQHVASGSRAGGPEGVAAADAVGGGDGGERWQGGGGQGVVVADLDSHVGAGHGPEGDRDGTEPHRPAHVQDQPAARLQAAEHRIAEVVLALPRGHRVLVDGVTRHGVVLVAWV